MHRWAACLGSCRDCDSAPHLGVLECKDSRLRSDGTSSWKLVVVSQGCILSHCPRGCVDTATWEQNARGCRVSRSGWFQELGALTVLEAGFGMPGEDRGEDEQAADAILPDGHGRHH